METKVTYPQQDGTMLQGAIINYCDMMLEGEKQEAWNALLPLYPKPNMHLTDVRMIEIHAVQQMLWINKAGSAAVDAFNLHWNALAAIALADHGIKLYTFTERRKLF